MILIKLKNKLLEILLVIILGITQLLIGIGLSLTIISLMFCEFKEKLKRYIKYKKLSNQGRFED